MKKIKKDNSGFTLVELLIAMAIIAIVLTPLYSNFRQSTYLNGKAKNAMNATNMASNLMEGMSAYTPEEIILGFYSNDSVSGNIPGRQNTLNIMPNEVTVAEYGDLTPVSGGYRKGFVTSNLVLGAGAYDYSSANYAQSLGTTAPQPSMEYLKIKESSSGKYYFYAQGVHQARGTYDIVVELDTTHDTGFSGDFNEDGTIDTSAAEVYGINDYKSAQITNVNPLFDGVYTENISQRQNAAAALLAKKTDPHLNLDATDLYPALKRTLTVNVDKDPATSFVTVTVEELYEITGDFHTPGGTWVNLGSAFAGQTMQYSTVSKQIFDGSMYKQDPRNIYIYYNANYYSNSTKYLDNFVINNPDNIPLDIYMVRVKTAETTEALENTYASELTVNEPPVSGDFETEIYSNLRDNILKKEADNAANRGNNMRCHTIINGHTIMSLPNADYEKVVHDTGGVKTEAEDRMYGVKMYVYDEGAADADFPEDMLVTEFSGSSLQ